MKIIASTILALLAFAANSVLCRLALAEGAIDAAGFTLIRLLSGVAVLVLIVLLTQRKSAKPSIAKGSWRAASMLFIYAAAFSYAYISLDTGTGALVLFGAVQITMITAGLLAGNRLQTTEWIGCGIAIFGFVYLIYPDLTTPTLSGFVLMAAAGISWGFYTLAGRGSKNSLMDTTYNFVRTLPMLLVLFIVTISQLSVTLEGAILAILSGALASGVGYTIWYIALSGLSSIQAAVLQLLVPVIATVGGVIFAGEMLTIRLAVSTILVLGGILLVILGKHYLTHKRPLK